MDARAWIGSLARDAESEAVEADIRAELEAHLELAEEALRGAGRTPEQASREARKRFGDLERTLRACRRERLGGRLMLVRIQWIVIALLGLTTVALALYGRSEAVRAATARDHAVMEAANARAMLQELRFRTAKGPVEQIVVAVGDKLAVQCPDNGDVNQVTEVQLDGQALFRGLGWVPVAGKPRPELEELLTARYVPLYEGAGQVYVIVKSPD